MANWTQQDIDRLLKKRSNHTVQSPLELNSNQIFLPGHVPSLKNGRSCVGTGRAIHSKPVVKYATEILPALVDLKPKWDEMTQGLNQYFLMYQFIRNYCWTRQITKGANKGRTKPYNRKVSFDFTGAIDTVNDCLTGQIYQFHKPQKSWKYTKLVGKNPKLPDQAKWIEDDNMDILAVYPHTKIIWDCERSGTILTVIKASTIEAFEKSIYQL